MRQTPVFPAGVNAKHRASDNATTAGLLMTMVIIFSSQSEVILSNPIHIILIGASNFFELAVAVAIALFGTTSPAVLVTTVGVLTEMPVMLILVKIANKRSQVDR